jgi:flagellar basal-body rod modification protein FlgD
MASGISGTGAAGSAAKAAGDRTSIAQNFDAFLLLLTTQLKNQNPMEPLDTNQFTQQLVQFASVEQQIKTNETLHSLLTSSQSSIVASASTFVGMQVNADGATTQLKDSRAEWRLNAARGGTGTITIRDKTGNVVASESKPLQAGGQTFTWNGRISTGQTAPEGEYTITVTGRDASGQTFSVKTEISGRVDSVDMAGETPVLLIGGLRVPLPNVKSISRPAA